MHELHDLSDEVVHARTGRSLREWFAILNRFGIKKRGHTAAARHLREHYRKLDDAWAKNLVVLYAFERQSAPEDRQDEGYSATARAEVPASAARAFEALTEPESLGHWWSRRWRMKLEVGRRFRNADGDAGRYLEVTPGKKLRFAWEHLEHAPGSEVTIAFTAKTARRCALRIQHEHIHEHKDAEALQEHWDWVLASLAAFLKCGTGVTFSDWAQARLAAKRPPTRKKKKSKAPKKKSKKKATTATKRPAKKKKKSAKQPARMTAKMKASAKAKRRRA